MDKQMLLPLTLNDQGQLRKLWEQIPEERRVKLVKQYARLIAQAARTSTSPQQQETDNEVTDQ